MTKQIKELNNAAVKPKNPAQEKLIIALLEAAGFKKGCIGDGVRPVCICKVYGVISKVDDTSDYNLITLDQLIWNYGIAPDDNCNYACWIECDDRLGWFEHEKNIYEGARLISTRPQETQEYMPEVGEECLYRLGDSCNWYKCKVSLLVGTQGVVMEGDFFEGVQYCSFLGSQAVKFKPLPTKQEIEREEFTKGYAEDIVKFSKYVMDNGYSNHILSDFLFDLGYRKPCQIK